MEVVVQEGPIKKEMRVEDKEEILPDGTVHHIHRERSSSVKKIKKCVTMEDGEVKVVEEREEEVPGSLHENIVETFEEPAKCVHEEKDCDIVLDDGTKVHKHVVFNRLEHRIHTHQESFDADHGHKAEDYDVDEVVPGTESAFVVDNNEESESSEGDVDGNSTGSDNS